MRRMVEVREPVVQHVPTLREALREDLNELAASSSGARQPNDMDFSGARSASAARTG